MTLRGWVGWLRLTVISMAVGSLASVLIAWALALYAALPPDAWYGDDVDCD